MPTPSSEERRELQRRTPAGAGGQFGAALIFPSGSFQALFPSILPGKEPRYILLKSRARIELLWERFLREIREQP